MIEGVFLVQEGEEGLEVLDCLFIVTILVKAATQVVGHYLVLGLQLEGCSILLQCSLHVAC